MPIFFNIQYNTLAVLAKREDIRARARDQAIQFAMYKVAAFWHRFIFPRHFERGARRRYRHTPRKRGYSAIKRFLAQGAEIPDPVTGERRRVDVKKGGRVDIVFEGSTERKAERNRRIHTTVRGFRMSIRVPRYIVMRRKKSYPNFQRELTTVTNDESNLLRKVFMKNYMRALRAIKTNTTLRV